MPKRKKFWQFKAKTDDESVGELFLYGEIADSTWWGDEVTPKQFKADLDALGDISTLNIYINSPGGDCFAGHAITSMIRRCKANTVAYVDGLAASMASVVASGCQKTVMPSNAMMMVHHPWTIAIGNANDFRKMADDMDKVCESSIAIYKEKTGMDDDEIKKLLDAETWMTAQDAFDLGFCDEIEEAKKVAASISDGALIFNGLSMQLSRFKSFPSSKMQFYHPVKGGVIPTNVSTETADENTAWEKPALSDFTDKDWSDLTDDEKRKIAGHYAWANEMPPEGFGNLKFPHHQPSDGKVVWNGVANCAARIDQANIPDEDVDKVKSHLAAHYRQFGKTPPWEDDSNTSGSTVSTPNQQGVPADLYQKMLKINERRSKI